MDNERRQAQEYKAAKDFERANEIYEMLWNTKQDMFDMWLGWEYAYCLKQMGDVDEAIKVSKETYLKYKHFRYNSSFLCWCIYEKYIDTNEK